MENKERNKNIYLTKIGSNPDLYHPFPDFDCSQENHTTKVKTKYRMAIKYIPQKDGSRFKGIYSQQSYSGIMESLKRVYGESFGILREVEEKEFIDDLMECEYFVVHTHSFMDSVRIIPIVANYRFSNFINVSKNFPHLIPEDGLGLLLPDRNHIYNLERLGYPPSRVVEYLASKRVCVGCGRIVDYSVPIPPLNWNTVPYSQSHPRYKPTGGKRGRPKKPPV